MTEHARVADHPVNKVFLDRWSPRAFTGETIPQSVLFTLFEAARWAPSSYNSQPWRFLYATNGNAYWDKFLGLLVEFNQGWAKTASALIFVVSETTMPAPGQTGRIPSHSHSFDAGAAWACLALQATMLGWYTHGMTGVDFARAKTELKVPDDHRVEAAIAVGRLGPKTLLPEALQAREFPSPRKPLADLIIEGGF